MMNKLICYQLLMFWAVVTYAQNTPIEVADLTVKVEGCSDRNVFYYGFAAGDQILLNIQEQNGKELKEIKVTEFFSETPIFQATETPEVKNKLIQVPQKSVYKFEICKGALTRRTCKLSIKRIPADPATNNFNTSVMWKTLYDTSYYDAQERYLVSRNIGIVSVKPQETNFLPPNTSGQGIRNMFSFQLPNNTRSWAFFLGSGENARRQYTTAAQQAERNRQQIEQTAQADQPLPPLSPTISAAITNNTYMSFNSAGANSNDRFNYAVMSNRTDAQNFINYQPNFNASDRGTTNLICKRMNFPSVGEVFVGITNEMPNVLEINIEVIAYVVNEEWGNRTVKKMKIQQRDVPIVEGELLDRKRR